jgi:hypothetical protein
MRAGTVIPIRPRPVSSVAAVSAQRASRERRVGDRRPLVLGQVRALGVDHPARAHDGVLEQLGEPDRPA